MKPLHIRMESFGSYKHENIDFAKVDHGIFLITGDTGAGKTTIFDAITYALYGDSSGGKRNAGMMISQYAAPGEYTEVEFCFKIGEAKYTIIRSPEQKKYKVKKDENGQNIYEMLKTSEAAKVKLILPDGTEFAGKKGETDNKIIDILGVDRNQFTQIAMLAQGDFVRLLHADSNERAKIFAKIFDTSLYGLIEQELETRYKDIRGRLDNNENEITGMLRDIKLSEESDYAEEWDKLGDFSETKSNELMALIAAINKELECKNAEYDALICGLDKERTDIEKQLEAANEINGVFDKYDEAVKTAAALNDRKSNIEETEKRISKAERALGIEADYSLLLNKKKDIESISHSIGKLNSELEKCRFSLARQKEEYEAAEKNYEQYDELIKQSAALEEKLSLYDEVDKLEHEYKKAQAELIRLKDRRSALDKLLDDIDDREKELAGCSRMSEDARNDYNEKNYAFIHNQAAILRRQLIEGEPCPVCGSIHHIAVETEEENFVTEKMVKDAAKTLETAVKNEKKAGEVLEMLKNKRIELETEVNTGFAVAQRDEADRKARLEAAKAKLKYGSRKEALETIRKTNEAADKLKNDKETASKLYNEILSQASDFTAKLQFAQDNLKKHEAELSIIVTKFNAQLAVNNFTSETDFVEALIPSGEMVQLRKSIQEYREKVINNQKDIEHYHARIDGKSRVDVTEFKKNIAQINIKKSEIEKLCKKINTKLSINRNAGMHIEESYACREKLKSEFVVIENVYKTACGKISKKRLSFQTYIQRSYFMRVIAAANKRLERMSDSQFVLRCRDMENLGTQGSVGLDLDVYSLVNDSRRDVKSLSGGESFQAALSMALGLSDVIQNAAGKIRIETMFIDEGFGSLSDETRNKALELLNELSEGKQLIGIISHVTELKAQVETKLIVKKTDKGSKAYWSMD